jgi:hypothetical protein
MTDVESKRRWWIPRYSLKTFLVVVMLFGGWLGWNLYEVRERTKWLDALKGIGAQIESYRDDEVVPPWRLAKMPVNAKLFGIKPIRKITLTDTRGFTLMDAKQISSRFPESQVRWTNGKLDIDVQNEH